MCEAAARYDRRDVRRLNVLRGHRAARAVRILRAFDTFPQRANGIAEEGAKSAHQLEAVVLGGVVASGDHHGAVGEEVMRREVQERRRSYADVDDIGARGHQPLRQSREEPWARQAAVAGDGDRNRLTGRGAGAESNVRREGTTDREDELIGEVHVGYAADVVFAKHVRRHRHGVGIAPLDVGLFSSHFAQRTCAPILPAPASTWHRALQPGFASPRASHSRSQAAPRAR